MAKKPVLVIIRRIVCYVAALVFGLFGVLVLIAGISFIADHDGTALPSIVLGIFGIAISALLFFTAGRGSADNSAGSQHAQANQGIPMAYPGPGDTNPHMAIPVQQGSTGSAPITTQATFEKLMLRSGDVLATLKDVVRHGESERALLSEMLVRTGLMEWSDSPKMSASKLRRNDRFWLNATIEDLSADDLDKVLAVEAALNIDQDSIGMAAPAGEARIAQVLAGTIDLNPAYSTQIGQVSAADLTSPTDGEWNCRLRIADFLENAPAPFRITFDMDVNLLAGLVEVALDVPRPASMSVLSSDATRQVVAARAYALRSALLVARGAFASTKRVKRVVVHCNARNDDALQTVLRITVAREGLPGLTAAARNPQIDVNGFPRDEAVEASFDATGWFAPICDWQGFSSPDLNVPGRFEPVEAMDGNCPDALVETTGARTLRDLGINENGERVATWNSVVKQLGDSTGQVVSTLMSIRNSARDLTVIEAADRTSKALVDGTVDVADKPAMAKIFVDGSSLDTAVRRAQRALEDDLNPDEAAQVISSLEDILAPIAETGMYLDDSDCVYRYFNSVAERFSYNRAFFEDRRSVRLVPDSYYIAHSTAARLCSSLGKVDEALAHADELIRVAPMTTDAALVKVRILEDAERVYEAADLLKEYIDKSSTARDIAICLYRLAYMEWKLGRSDLAVACYQRSISMFPPNSAQAESELADLLAGDETLRRLSGDDEVRKVLADANIPCGPVGELRARSLAAAMACVDANVFAVARPMTGVALEFNRDDALTDVHRSMKPLV